MGQGPSLKRRSLLGAGVGASLGASWALGGCTRSDGFAFDGGWVGVSVERGHRLRDSKSGALPPPALQRRCGVAIIGAGIAGLAAARALAREGVADVHVFELEDEAGGNSRGHQMGGIACPLGAHYLPLPGPHAHEVAELLDEFGLRRLVDGQPIYDERHLCHSPQERLWYEGRWVGGVLPPDVDLVQTQRFAQLVAEAQSTLAFAMPTHRAAWTAGHAALDAVTFADWLARHRLDDPALRWFLDYSCLDDFGADASVVSAWAGLHYFASRHGFDAPGEGADTGSRDAVLTWPEGNAWLARRLAAPLGERLHSGRIALRIHEERHAVSADLWNVAEQRLERWQAQQLIVALPLHVAVHVVEQPSNALQTAAAAVPHAPWLVANLQLHTPLSDRPGVPPAWDNVPYRGRTLGYVDATHQSLQAAPSATLLTAYWALGSATPDLAAQRRALLEQPWRDWAQRVIADLALAHPDLPGKVQRVDLMRYGHAMAIPAPGVRGHAALHALQSSAAAPGTRLHLAHADLSGYSVFEEAFFHGHEAARRVALAMRSS